VVTNLAEASLNSPVVVRRIGGSRPFRRRLLEMGLVPGTTVRILNIAPLGDPLEVEARGCRLSVRHHEAAEVEVGPCRAI
jgi:ferrous iron transport protein A